MRLRSLCVMALAFAVSSALVWSQSKPDDSKSKSPKSSGAAKSQPARGKKSAKQKSAAIVPPEVPCTPGTNGNPDDWEPVDCKTLKGCPHGTNATTVAYDVDDFLDNGHDVDNVCIRTNVGDQIMYASPNDHWHFQLLKFENKGSSGTHPGHPFQNVPIGNGSHDVFKSGPVNPNIDKLKHACYEFKGTLKVRVNGAWKCYDPHIYTCFDDTQCDTAVSQSGTGK
jgi:hypothetical protein